MRYVLTALCLGLVLFVSEAQAATTVNVPVGKLCQLTSQHGPNTTYVLKEGTHDARCTEYGVSVQPGDRFIKGSGPRPRVSGMGEAKRVFNTFSADGASFDSLYILGATGDDSCEPGCGTGIGGRANGLTVTNSTFSGLPNTGIAYPGGPKCLTVRNVRMVGVGSLGFSGMDPDAGPSGRTSGGIKATGCASVTDSTFIDTFWSAVWCDEDCEPFLASRNTIDGFGKAGIHIEGSRGPARVFENDISRGGIHGDKAPGNVAGILVRRSNDVDIHHNRVSRQMPSGGGRNAILLTAGGEDNGEPPDAVGLQDVRVRSNLLGNGALVGCSEAGVRCVNNR